MPIRDEATNVFMGLPGDGARLELTHNHDRDEPYEIGSGYGHIAISADDLDGTLERLAADGIEPERPPYQVREGGSRICFVRDPDQYRIELIERSSSLKMHDRDDQDRDDVCDLDHRVDRRPGGVLVGIADGVAGD